MIANNCWKLQQVVRVTQFGRFQFDVVEEFLQVLVVGLIRSFFTLVTIGLLVGLTLRHL